MTTSAQLRRTFMNPTMRKEGMHAHDVLKVDHGIAFLRETWFIFVRYASEQAK
jgi:hypothetical protein